MEPPTTPATPPPTCHQTNHLCRETGPVAVLHTDVGRGPTGSTTTLDLVGTTVHLVRITRNQMPVVQPVGTHHVSFLQHPEWPNKSARERHMRNPAAKSDTHSRPMKKYVRHTVCFGGGTNSCYHGPRHVETRPATGRRNGSSIYQAPQFQQYCSWRPTDSKPHCDLAERTATCGCYRRPRHAASVCRCCRWTR